MDINEVSITLGTYFKTEINKKKKTMKKTITIIALATATLFASPKDKLVKGASELLAKAPSGTVAILPFESRIPGDSKSGQTVAEVVVSVASASGISLVEREALAKILMEQDFSESDLVDQDNAIEVGKLLTAKYLVIGSVGEMMGERLISMRLINTETGEVVSSSSVSMGVDAFKSMQEEINPEATQTSAVVLRSALIPGWGQMFANRTGRGTAWMSAFAVAVGAGVYTTIQAGAANDDYTAFGNRVKTGALGQTYCQTNSCTGGSPDDTDDWASYRDPKEKKLWDDYGSAYQTSLIVWGTAGAIWAANLVDAYIVGSERKEKNQMYFSALPTPNQGVQLSLSYSF